MPIKEDIRYYISSRGRIKNLDGSFRKFTKNKDGYLKTNFYINKKMISFTILHRLVMETFIGDRPNNYGINHKDGNKENNYDIHIKIILINPHLFLIKYLNNHFS